MFMPFLVSVSLIFRCSYFSIINELMGYFYLLE